jgi:hypothetical protein
MKGVHHENDQVCPHEKLCFTNKMVGSSRVGVCLAVIDPCE